MLGHDLVAMAAPVTKWSVQIERADEIALIMRRAFKVATDPPKGPVFVALPIDVMEQETAVEAMLPDRLLRARARSGGIEAVASLLLKSSRPAIVVGDDGARDATAELTALARSRRLRVVRGHRRSRLVSHRASELPAWACPRRRAVRQALDDADVVLLIGGPFFEEVWWAPGSPLPRAPPRSRWSRRPSGSPTISRWRWAW